MAVFFGGLPIQKDEETLKTTNPHIVVGTPGRILALIRNKKLNLKHIKHFILDECDKMLEQLGKQFFLFIFCFFNFVKKTNNSYLYGFWCFHGKFYLKTMSDA